MSGPTRRTTVDLGLLCICPNCHGDLAWADNEVRCEGCDRRYLRRDGIALLVPDDVGFLENDERWAPQPALGSHPGLKAWIDRARARVAVSTTFKTKHSRSRAERFVASFTATHTILNVGAGGTSYGANVVNLEIEASSGIDVVGVAESLPIRSESCDGVILMAVLEHVQDAGKALDESKRVLAHGGRILVDVPFIQGYHAAPGDYRRFTEQGLRAELERIGFEVDSSGVALGPGSAMAWITGEFLALLVSGRSAFGYRVARNLTSILAAPIKYADVWLEGHPMAAQIPGGVWAVARRPEAQRPFLPHPDEG